MRTIRVARLLHLGPALITAGRAAAAAISKKTGGIVSSTEPNG